MSNYLRIGSFVEATPRQRTLAASSRTTVEIPTQLRIRKYVIRVPPKHQLSLTLSSSRGVDLEQIHSSIHLMKSHTRERMSKPLTSEIEFYEGWSRSLLFDHFVKMET